MDCASIGAAAGAEEKSKGARFEYSGGIFDSSESSRLMREAISTVMAVEESRPDAGFLGPLFEILRQLMAALGKVDE